jgi:fumarylacetoacetate (FAA) hydrolase
LKLNIKHMKLVTYLKDGHDQLGIVVDGNIYSMETLHNDLPTTMAMFLNFWEEIMPLARAVEQKIKDGLVRNVNSGPRTTSFQLQGCICLSPACCSCQAQQKSGYDSGIRSIPHFLFYQS